MVLETALPSHLVINLPRSLFNIGLDIFGLDCVASILIIEDEDDLREELSDFLRAMGNTVHSVDSIRRLMTHVKANQPDILIVDRMLPDGDSLSTIADMRRNGQRMGIIALTAKGNEEDRLSGYAVGVDHYLVKPVRLQELGAVVSALAWRMQALESWLLHAHTWDLKTPGGQLIRLTAQETSFLQTLLQSKGTVVTRRKLLEGLGKNFLDYDPRNLDALLLRLRKKVASVTVQPLPVKTVHGVGYTVLPGISIADAQ